MLIPNSKEFHSVLKAQEESIRDLTKTSSMCMLVQYRAKCFPESTLFFINARVQLLIPNSEGFHPVLKAQEESILDLTKNEQHVHDCLLLGKVLPWNYFKVFINANIQLLIPNSKEPHPVLKAQEKSTRVWQKRAACTCLFTKGHSTSPNLTLTLHKR